MINNLHARRVGNAGGSPKLGYHVMDIKHLTAFCTLAEELHFSRAAQRLHIVQSALTAQIRQLEDVVGTKLFTRNRNAPVQLTSAGGLFLREARKALSQFERTKAVGSRVGRGEVGQFRVGYVASALYAGAIGRIMHGFQAEFPGVDIAFHESETPRQIEAVRSGDLDVGFVRHRKFPRDIVGVDIVTEPLLLAMHRDCGLAMRNGRISPAALAESRFVVTLSDREPGLYAAVLELGRAGHFAPDIAFHVQSLTSLLAVVASGLAIALVPSSLQAVQLPEVAYAKIAGVALTQKLTMIRADEPASPIVDRFSEHVATLARTARRT